MTQPLDRRLAQVRKLAWLCVALVLAITTLSAFIRLSRAGIGCEPWPQCHAARAGMTVEQIAPLDSAAVDAARIAHRIAASVALLLIIALVMKTLAQQPVLLRQGRLAGALLAVALFLAILGRSGGDSRSAAVALGNLMGGLVMFALACRLVHTSAASPADRAPAHPRLRAWAVAGIVLVVLQVSLGGLMSALNEGSGCANSWLCDSHRVTAVASVLLLVPLGLLARRHRARAGVAVLVLVMLQATLGTAMLFTQLAFPLALAHNVVAALLLASVAILP